MTAQPVPKSWWFLVFAPVLVLCAVLAPSAGAQHVDLLLSQSSSELSELSSPTGLGLALTSTPWGPLAFRAGYRYRFDRTEQTGQTCDRYFPTYEGCVEETLESRSAVHTTFVGLALSGAATSHVELGAGVSGSLNFVTSERAGRETGRSRDPVAGGMHPGLSIFLLGRYLNVGGSPVDLGIRLFSERIEFLSCATDTYAPFCPSTSLIGLEIGIGWSASGE